MTAPSPSDASPPTQRGTSNPAPHAGGRERRSPEAAAPRPLRIQTSPATFSGAPCAGRWELHDPPADDEPRDAVAYRHAAAVALCATCPCIIACGELVAALPAAQRAGGVWAGRRGSPPRRRNGPAP